MEIVDVENAGKNLPALTDSQTTPRVGIILLRKQDKSCCNIGLHVEECRFLQQDITTGSIIAQHIEQVPRVALRAWQETTRKIDFTVRVYHNILAGISSRSIDEVVKSNVKLRYSDKNLPRVVPIVETAHKHCV